MTRPRKEQISIQDTPYYHIVSRCVRRHTYVGKIMQPAKTTNTDDSGSKIEFASSPPSSPSVKEQTELAALIQFSLPIKPLLPFEGATVQEKQAER